MLISPRVLQENDIINIINPEKNEICHITLKDKSMYIEEITLEEIIDMAIQNKIVKKGKKINWISLEEYINEYVRKYKKQN